MRFLDTGMVPTLRSVVDGNPPDVERMSRLPFVFNPSNPKNILKEPFAASTFSEKSGILSYWKHMGSEMVRDQ